MISDPSTWVDAHGDRLFRYALSRLRDERAAEDLIQDTFLAAFKAREKFRGDSSELTWMTGILRNKIFELLRKQAKEVPLTGPDEDCDREEALFDGRHWRADAAPRDWGNDPHRKAETAEFSAALRSCLDALTPGVARAFVLREMEGMGHQESAEALGVPPGRLAVLLYRARMRLRRCLERGYFAPEAAR
ncbi:MAG: sigma-70 family RNA polymerase sigma factor [Elusimicrobia bacterium]|nr:sigma-70 family RNA polymerase sigma factor [Elusimicrobiota bacterium]